MTDTIVNVKEGFEGISIVKLDMLRVGPEDIKAALLTSDTTYKVKAVEKLGIEIHEGETPLQAWLRYIAEENGLLNTLPCDPKIKDAIYASPEALKFMFYIS